MTTQQVTTYLDGEGRPSMEACIRLAAEWCMANEIRTLVIFTGTGEGPHFAAREVLAREQYYSLRIVAVTPPVGRPYRLDPSNQESPLVRAGLSAAMREELMSLAVEVVSAHLPFKEMYDGKERTSEWTRVSESFGILGGGFSLCIQAVLVACDAGAVEHGERVVALTSDTAVVIRACRTESFLSPLDGMLAEHIICRPARYNISKRMHEAFTRPSVEPEAQSTQLSLPTGGGLITAGEDSEVASGLSDVAADPDPESKGRRAKRSPKRRRS